MWQPRAFGAARRGWGRGAACACPTHAQPVLARSRVLGTQYTSLQHHHCLVDVSFTRALQRPGSFKGDLGCPRSALVAKLGHPTAAIALWTPCPPSADAIIGSLACLALGLAIGLRSRSLGLVVAVGSAALLVRPVQAGEQQPSMSRWGGQPARLLRKVCHAAAMRGIALLTLAPSLTLARCVT